MKYSLLSLIVADLFQPALTGEGGAPAGDVGVEQPPVDQPPAGDTPPVKKVFTQDEVNSILNKDKQKHQEQVKKAIGEVEALKSKAKLTQEERDELDKRLQQMNQELLTKEELAKQEKERIKRTLEGQVKQTAEERDAWKNRYTTAQIKRSITDAAVVSGAYNPSQIVALLHGNTRLVEKLGEDGQPTGEYAPKIRFDDVDKDGKPVSLDLSPEEAVKRMKEKDEYLNLFKGEGVGGIGASNQPAGKKTDARILAKDPAKYREARKGGQLKF